MKLKVFEEDGFTGGAGNFSCFQHLHDLHGFIQRHSGGIIAAEEAVDVLDQTGIEGNSAADPDHDLIGSVIAEQRSVAVGFAGQFDDTASAVRIGNGADVSFFIIDDGDGFGTDAHNAFEHFKGAPSDFSENSFTVIASGPEGASVAS